MKKTITIKSITLNNFKGIKNLSIDFGSNATEIYGANAAGKTTIFDAFTWLLFGKDHLDNTKFGIKTYDESNNVIEKIDHSVQAVIMVGEEEVEISRTLREKWVKRRGASETEFDGNETIYSWNDVPLKASEFSDNVNEIIDENVFKLITNPLGFNSLHWEGQRNILVEVIGGVNQEDIVSQNKDFAELLNSLGNKSIELFQREVKAKIKKAKDEIKFIPTRIDEVNNNTPDKLDFKAIEKEIASNQADLNKIESQIKDSNKLKEEELKQKSELRMKVISLQNQIDVIKTSIQNAAKEQYTQANLDRTKLQKDLEFKKADLKESETLLAQLTNRKATQQMLVKETEKSIVGLRAKWGVENAKPFLFDETATKCPCCDRDYEADKIESEKESQERLFKANKIKVLKSITDSGIQLTDELEKAAEAEKVLKGRIEKGQANVDAIKTEIALIANKFESTPESILDDFISVANEEKEDEISGLKAEISKVELELESIGQDDEENNLKEEAKQIKEEIDTLNKLLHNKVLIDLSNKRIKQLEEEETKLSNTILELEKTEFIIEAYNRASIEMLESKVNDKFNYVKFNLFEQQVNGGEKETCEALINGVPFSDANTGSKINAGIDIINTLCNHYQISAPIFIDNAESVDIVVPLESQNIRLIKNTADKELRIETKIEADHEQV